ncbi:hypothetical protein PXK56_17965 [Phaeobacter gallaeciensis]|uniref:hypothetical protein n=1 Tax=Phaeobacter gallaeciensis TaxID=60890 RepID=UPI0023808C0A|nr:hypothetical protein [Phaeobacter gallaeciensis]MDE4297076.1 hypothetical protein [Phaeobacter gallaeciensis]
MPELAQPVLTVTQSKVAFLLSLLTLGGIVYAATDTVVRYQIEFETLKESYSALAEGQVALKSEVKSLRETVDGEIRHMTQAINRLSDTLEERSAEVAK